MIFGIPASIAIMTVHVILLGRSSGIDGLHPSTSVIEAIHSDTGIFFSKWGNNVHPLGDTGIYR